MFKKKTEHEYTKDHECIMKITFLQTLSLFSEPFSWSHDNAGLGRCSDRALYMVPITLLMGKCFSYEEKILDWNCCIVQVLQFIIINLH